MIQPDVRPGLVGNCLTDKSGDSGYIWLDSELGCPQEQSWSHGLKGVWGCPPALLLSLMDGGPGDLARHLDDWILALEGMTQGAKAVAPSLSEEGAGVLPAGSLRVSLSSFLESTKTGGLRGTNKGDAMTVQLNAAGVWGVPSSLAYPPRLGDQGG